MGFSRVVSTLLDLVYLMVLLVLVLLHSSYAQDSYKDYIAAHNVSRASVGVPPVKWNHTLAFYAKNYADQQTGQCKLVQSKGPYGENLAGSSSGNDLTGEAAVELWAEEKSSYDYKSNTCVKGTTCSHHTQVVWRNSVEIGCASVRCKNGGIFIICSYYPSGNHAGERPH